MTEILYDPKLNEILLFSGACEVDLENKMVVLYVEGSRKKRWKMIESKHLVHIGWL